MTAPNAPLIRVGFGAAIGSSWAAAAIATAPEAPIVALGAIVALLAIANVVEWAPVPEWVLPVLLAAAAALLVALAGGAPGAPSAMLLAAVLPAATVLMRRRVADQPDAGFVQVSSHDAGIAFGAAAIFVVVAFGGADWVGPSIGAASLGFALGLAATPDTARQDEGMTSALAGWGRWSMVAWGSIGIAAGTAVPGVLTIQAERWAINLQGRTMTVATGLLIGAGALAIGHWYHRLGEAGDRRLANTAGLASTLGAAMLIGAAYSTTLIGVVTVLMAAIATGTFAVAVIDALVWRKRTSRARLGAISLSVGALISGAAVGVIVATGLETWTARSLVVLASLPMITTGLVAVLRTPQTTQETPDAPQPVAAPATSFVSMSGVRAGYGPITVLSDIDLDVALGEIIAVMGMNGVGKTTLLKTLAGLLTPTGGRITIGGADVTGFPASWMSELGVCHVAGSDSVVPELTVDENLAMFSHATDVGPAEFGTRRERVLATFPALADRTHQRAETLSGGERQMLALAKATIQEPRLLLIDEFSLGLAPSIVDQLIPTIRALTADETPTILVEQNVDTALALATRVVVLDKGRIRWQGAADRLAGDTDLIEELFLPPVGADLP